jgi:hypothetical protein
MSNSILGQEFINYRKNTNKNHRDLYSSRIRNQGIGNVPIVIDSLDRNISVLLSGTDIINTGRREWRYGGEFVFYLDTTIEEVLNETEIILKSRGYIQNDSIPFRLGIEDGTLIDPKDTIGNLYHKYRNNKDRILYLVLTKETTVYNYILSIFKYLFPSFFKKVII